MSGNRKSLLRIVDMYMDMCINFASAVIAYLFVLLAHRPVFSLRSAPVIAGLFFSLLFGSFIYQLFNLYHTLPNTRNFTVSGEILRVNFTYFGILAVLTTLFARGEERDFLLTWVLIAFAVSSSMLIFKRNVVISILMVLRKKQFSLRKVIIIGDNSDAAADFVREVTNNSRYGFMILGYVGDKISPQIGCDKLGSFRDLDKILDKYKPSDAVFAIDAYDKRRLIRLVNICDNRCVKVYFLPVIYGFFKSGRQLEQVGDLPIVNIHTTPLDNRANAMVKRAVDVLGSALLILLTSPLMLIAAIGVKISSPGPVFFTQERLGKMGKPFTMLKFRSMRVNRESDVTWTTGNDPRKTRFGSFIRRTSIDELPQLFNVLAGSMSLVGPRPEIPSFVAYFKTVIPLYMVKHYVKPGMTGLAQIRGLRGDTSVEERIHADINYIENWSLLLDLKILFATPFKAFNKSEQYVPPETPPTPQEDQEETEPTGQAVGMKPDETPAAQIDEAKPDEVPTAQAEEIMPDETPTAQADEAKPDETPAAQTEEGKPEEAPGRAE